MPRVYDKDKASARNKPDWLKIKLRGTADYADVARIVKEHGLHTICSSGMCPNKAECWSRRTATFMILGDVCTRSCRFCATRSGRAMPPDDGEPEKVAESVSLMGLRYVVITSVTRDDLPDGGASHWAATVRAIKARNQHTSIELLIPDFDARGELIDTVLAAGADVVGHNIEPVRRLPPQVRSRARYDTSLEVLPLFSVPDYRGKTGENPVGNATELSCPSSHFFVRFAVFVGNVLLIFSFLDETANFRLTFALGRRMLAPSSRQVQNQNR